MLPETLLVFCRCDVDSTSIFAPSMLLAKIKLNRFQIHHHELKHRCSELTTIYALIVWSGVCYNFYKEFA